MRMGSPGISFIDLLPMTIQENFAGFAVCNDHRPNQGNKTRDKN
jgi:hypothetical protein